MKKFFAVLVAMVVVAVFSTVAQADETTRVGLYWSVSGVWNTHSPEGKLVHKRIRFSRLDWKDEMFIESSVGEPEWPAVNRLKLYDRIWTGVNSAGQIEVISDAEPSAGVKLGRTLIE